MPRHRGAERPCCRHVPHWEGMSARWGGTVLHSKGWRCTEETHAAPVWLRYGASGPGDEETVVRMWGLRRGWRWDCSGGVGCQHGVRGRVAQRPHCLYIWGGRDRREMVREGSNAEDCMSLSATRKRDIVARCYNRSEISDWPRECRAGISLFTPAKVGRGRFWVSLRRFACGPGPRPVVVPWLPSLWQ